MKGKSSKHKVVLDFEYDFDFTLFAIATTLKEYKLSYQIQKTFFIRWTREADIEINFPKKNLTGNFSRYSCKIELMQQELNLLSNKYKGNLFIPELKIADYLFMVKGECDAEVEEILERLKNIEEVQAVMLIDVSALKSKANLIFD